MLKDIKPEEVKDIGIAVVKLWKTIPEIGKKSSRNALYEICRTNF